MNTSRRSLGFNISEPSYQINSIDDIETMMVKNYIKDLLKSRIFLGRYLERRLSDERIGYRDIVLLSAAEVDLKRDLIESQHKLRAAYPNIYWIGISDADVIGHSGTCLWTEIENQPFGPFWFQIRRVEFRDNEIIIKLNCIRHISDSFLELEPILTGSAKKNKINNEGQSESSTASLSETYNEIVGTLKTAMSIKNVKEFVTFLIACVIAIFTGGTALINFLGTFVIALLRETSILIKNSTPMFLGFLDFVGKIVGGFYILLAMVFKPNSPFPSNTRSVTQRQARRMSNEYYDRGFD